MDMAKITRRNVTLLELLIVIAILALVGGLVSIGINRALFEQRFRTEVSLIVDQLRLAQDLMLILGTDVRVVFAEDKNDKNSIGNKSSLELETSISRDIEREILRKSTVYKAVKGISFKDDEQKAGQITVKFQSKGAVMSKGLMRLATVDGDNPPPGTLQSYICLSGYPRHIYSEDDVEKAKENCKEAIESTSDTALTQDTFSKIPELFKSEKESGAQKDQKKDDTEEKKTTGPKKGPASNPTAAK